MVAAQHNNLARIRELLAAGVFVDEEDYEGVTPLAYAIINGRQEAATLFLEAGADINHVDQKGHNVLINLISSHRNTLIPFIIAKGINIEFIDPMEETPLELAAYCDNVVAVTHLLDAGAKRRAAALKIAIRRWSLRCIDLLK